MQPSSYHWFERLCSSERPETWESTTSTFLHCQFLKLYLLYPQCKLPVFAFSVLGMKSFANHTAMAACNVIMELHSCWPSHRIHRPKRFRCVPMPSAVGQSIPSQSPERPQPRCLLGWPEPAQLWCMSAIHWSFLDLSATSNRNHCCFARNESSWWLFCYIRMTKFD